MSNQILIALDQLAHKLVDSVPSTIWIALSGGMDSMVLLHAATEHPILSSYPLRAIHVNHGLQADALGWQKHCCRMAKTRSIDIEIHQVTSQPQPGESVEAWARTVRYDAFKSVLQPGDVLLLAHHLDDQAETMLLRLCRGHGPTGLAAMPAQRQLLPECTLIRPFLALPKQTLQDYAVRHQLSWLDDATNVDQRFDRNYIRHQLMPSLVKRWPAVVQNMVRSADLCRQESDIVHKWARQQIAKWPQTQDQSLSIQQLGSYSDSEQMILVRHWLHKHTDQYPSYRSLITIFETLIWAKADAVPCIRLRSWQVRRFQNRLYLLSRQQWIAIPGDYQVNWDGQQPLVVPGQSQPMTRQLLKQQGLAVDQLDWVQVSVRFRQGGERCHPVGRNHSQTLKKLLQEYRIPPWQRNRLPLIFCGDILVMVVGLWVCKGFGL